MKKVFALLFIGATLTFAACESKPKTEETTTTDSTAVMADSASMMATDSTSMMADSAAADTTKK